MIGSRTSGDARLLALLVRGDLFLKPRKDPFLVYQISLIPPQQGPDVVSPGTAQCKALHCLFIVQPHDLNLYQTNFHHHGKT